MSEAQPVRKAVPSRRKRWAGAVAAAQAAMDELRGAIEAHAGDVRSALQDLEEVRAEYEEMFNGLGEKAQEGERGEALRAVAQDVDPTDGEASIDSIESALDEIDSLLNEANEIGLV